MKKRINWSTIPYDENVVAGVPCGLQRLTNRKRSNSIFELRKLKNGAKHGPTQLYLFHSLWWTSRFTSEEAESAQNGARKLLSVVVLLENARLTKNLWGTGVFLR